MKSCLEFLKKSHLGKVKQPAFKLYSSQIEILSEPIDFYLQLHRGVKYSTKRILMSTLYLGTGNLEKYLVAQMDNSIKRNKKLKVGMLMDYMRGTRLNKHQESSRSLLEGLKKNNLHNNNVKLAFYYNPLSSKTITLDSESGLREIFGVHHMKFFVFDNDVLLTGANMSEDYFVERQDRYFLISNAPELANYLQDLYDVLSNNSFQVHENGELQLFNNQPSPAKNPSKFIKVFANQFKMFLYSNNVDPKQIESIFKNEEKILSQNTNGDMIKDNFVDKKEPSKEFENNPEITKKRESAEEAENEEIIDLVPDQYFKENKEIRTVLQERKQKATDLLKDSFDEIEINQIMRKLEDTLSEREKGYGELKELGGPVYFFPTLQLKVLDYCEDEKLVLGLLDLMGEEKGYSMKLASGYLNLTDAMSKRILEGKIPFQVDLLTASPQANGFLNGGFIKNMIPFMYRYFTYQILRKAASLNRKDFLRVFEYYRGQWTFHSKGMWVYHESVPDPILTVIGSSNFCDRSYQRDTEIQFYIYSECQKFSKQLQIEQQRQFQHSQDVSQKPLTRTGHGIKIHVLAFAKLLKSFL